MDWQEYETRVFEEIKSLYLTAEIFFDRKLPGQFSQTKRQCDVVIDERSGGECVRTLVDAKYKKRKIDVKGVEEFVGLLRDVNCDRGIIVAANGFTPAAQNLAFYGLEDVDLDILNLDDFGEFQGIGAIPYSGQLGLLVRSPLGWITDIKKREGMVVSFYQRGLSFEQAKQCMEFMYLNFWHMGNQDNLDDLIQLQEANLREFSENEFRFKYSLIDCGRHGEIKIREAEFIGKDHSEITAFLTIKRDVVLGVMHTSKVKSRKNLRKLVNMLTLALPVKIKSLASKAKSIRKN